MTSLARLQPWHRACLRALALPEVALPLARPDDLRPHLPAQAARWALDAMFQRLRAEGFLLQLVRGGFTLHPRLGHRLTERRAAVLAALESSP